MGNDTKELTGAAVPIGEAVHNEWARVAGGTLGHDFDLAELCECLANFRLLRAQLAVFEDDLTEEIAAHVHVHKEVDGVGVVEVKRGKDRKAWDHDRLTALVTARALDERKLNEDTGEYEREAEAVARVLRDCAGVAYWKTTGLRKRGIDPDEYCETSPGRISVILP